MKLDYYQKSGAFGLALPRTSPQVRTIMREHGLDYSEPDSTPSTAMLFTRDPYAASAYGAVATPRARRQLGDILVRVEKSQVKHGTGRYPTPDGKELWPFQVADMDYLVETFNRGAHALDCDEPGLGKTPVSIVLANEMRAKRVLVVCPASIREQWRDRIREWSTMEKPLVYPILKSSDGVHPRAEWTIVSFDLLRSDPIKRGLVAGRYDLLIIDEAHYLKTSSTGRTKAVFLPGGLSSVCGSIIGLTGTPLPNRPRECFTLARHLCHSAIDFMTETDFQARYNPMRTLELPNGGRRTAEAVGRLPELQARLRANFMTRHLKRDVLNQLPELRIEIVHTGEDGDIRKALEAEKLLDIDPENLKGASAEVLGHISVVRKMMGMAKAPHVARYVADLLEGGDEKLVVFGWHIAVLDHLEHALHRYGLVRVDGATPAHKRREHVKKFGADPKTRVFLGNLQSIGTGTDGLQQACSHAIFAENSWTPSDNQQGISRLERIGQNNGILAEFVVAPGSLDERILGSSIRKMRNIYSALDERFGT